MLKQESSVKRCDLELRTKYFGIQTEIYQLDMFRFVIFCNNYSGNFEAYQKILINPYVV